MSQYDNPFGSSGGGYLQSGSPFSAGGSPGGIRRTEISNSLSPFTVSQLNQATQARPEAEWRVDDVEIGQITIVGQVASIQRQTTNCVYLVDDGTGRIEVRDWVDSSGGDDASKWGTIEEQKYVRVTGSLKSFGNKRYINATHIRNIKDPHEIYFHILEAIAMNLILERGPPSNPGVATPKKNAHSGISAYSAPSTAALDRLSHLPALQRDIYRFILNQPPQDEGIHVALIAKAIGASGEDAGQISDALDKLMDDGLVFTTIDDSHFKGSF